jgi:hypothetical protein
VTANERKAVAELLEAGEALHRADGESGLRDVWRQRWIRHALAAVRKLSPFRPTTTPPAGATP